MEVGFGTQVLGSWAGRLHLLGWGGSGKDQNAESSPEDGPVSKVGPEEEPRLTGQDFGSTDHHSARTRKTLRTLGSDAEGAWRSSQGYSKDPGGGGGVVRQGHSDPARAKARSPGGRAAPAGLKQGPPWGGGRAGGGHVYPGGAAPAGLSPSEPG